MRKRGRLNQKQRTRKDLLSAAARLLREGRTPSVAEVAEEAMVSRATAYRYFPSQEALVAEAPIDGIVPTPEELFDDDASTDPVERLDRAEAALHEMVYANETQLRVMLARSLAQSVRGDGGDDVPVRQNRRGALIEAALEPARKRLDDATYDRLCASLASFFGTESLIVFTDVLQMDASAARSVKRWAIRALVRAALAESGERHVGPT